MNIEGMATRVYRPKKCVWCELEFVPTAAAQARCGACRVLTPEQAGRCSSCGSRVSGEALWGPDWTGECDRAEQISLDLYEKLRYCSHDGI